MTLSTFTEGFGGCERDGNRTSLVPTERGMSFYEADGSLGDILFTSCPIYFYGMSTFYRDRLFSFLLHVKFASLTIVNGIATTSSKMNCVLHWFSTSSVSPNGQLRNVESAKFGSSSEETMLYIDMCNITNP